MDYILTKISDAIDLCDPDEQDRYSLSRQRIEYSLMFLLGLSWNMNKERLSPDVFCEIAKSFNNMAIGTAVGNIRKLDKENKIFKKANSDAINSYPTQRNNFYGHGYITYDNESCADIFDTIYKTLVNTVDFLKEDVDLITVTGKEDNNFEGILCSPETGRPVRWICHESAFPHKTDYKGSTYAKINNEYIKISPFVRLIDKGNKILIFTSLEDSLSGKVRFARLLDSGVEEGFFEDFIMMSATDKNNRNISPNRTIINSYKTNYKKYYSANLLVKDKLKNALVKDNSTVCVTLWGHGGVGKTACIQKQIEEFFSAPRQYFQYIVFTSAKDKQYNTLIGKLERLDADIKTYRDIINIISQTMFEDYDAQQFSSDFSEYEKRIIEIKYKVLFVIDDLETFPDEEKKKIQAFISKLDAHYHKVVITTRIKAFNLGTEIPTEEMNQEDSIIFLTQIIDSEYHKKLEAFKKLVEDPHKAETIYIHTSGRPIFLYQLANIYATDGYKEKLIKSFTQAPDVRRFLYDDLYGYLSEKARMLFICISQIVDEQDYTFNSSHLEYLFNEYETLETEMDELIKMRVIEYNSALMYKVYSSEIYQMMNDKYKAYPDQSFKSKITERLKEINLSAKNETVYETWLKKANSEAHYESEANVNVSYRRLIDNNSSPQDIREKALINLANYYMQNLKREEAQKVLEEYERIMRGWHDSTRYFVLQVTDDSSKICEILGQYFMVESKTDVKNLDLFSILVNTRNIIAIRNDFNRTELAKTYNENGSILFNIAKDGKIFDETKATADKMENYETIKHFMAKAVTSTIGLQICMLKKELNPANNNKIRTTALEMCEFGLTNLQKYPQLISDIRRYEMEIKEFIIQPVKNYYEDFVEKHNLEDIYEFLINKVDNTNGYLVGTVDRFTCSIPRKELPAFAQNNMDQFYSKGSKLFVKVKRFVSEKQQVHLKLFV